MKLTVKEAATHLGCSPRAVRAALTNGRIRGYKHAGRWVVSRANLPLTGSQEAAAAKTLDDMHAAVDEAVPAHLRRQLGAAGVAGLRAFENGRRVYDALGDAPGAADARRGGGWPTSGG